jgi:hypothetical protein
MSRIAQFSASFHLGMLELATILFVAASFFISFVEADMLALYETMMLAGSISLNSAKATGVPLTELEYGWGMVLRNAIVPLIGSFAAMLIPVLIYKARSPFSLSGQRIDLLEKIVIITLIAVAVFMPFVTWSILDNALNTLLLSKKIEPIFYDYRMYKQQWTIIANFTVEIFIGLMSIYEIMKGDGGKSAISEQPKSKPKQDEKNKTTGQVNVPANNNNSSNNTSELPATKSGNNSKFAAISNNTDSTNTTPPTTTTTTSIISAKEADNNTGKK